MPSSNIVPVSLIAKWVGVLETSGSELGQLLLRERPISSSPRVILPYQVYEYVQQAEKRDREKMKDQELFSHNVRIMIIIEQFGRVFVIAYHP